MDGDLAWVELGERDAIAGHRERIWMEHARCIQVARVGRRFLEFWRLHILDQLAAWIQAPPVWRPEDRRDGGQVHHRVLCGGDAVKALMRFSERQQRAFELVHGLADVVRSELP